MPTPVLDGSRSKTGAGMESPTAGRTARATSAGRLDRLRSSGSGPPAVSFDVLHHRVIRADVVKLADVKWFNAATARVALKRSLNPAADTLMATVRSRCLSRAFQTSPIPGAQWREDLVWAEAGSGDKRHYLRILYRSGVHHQVMVRLLHG
jgi:hypothetical protein